MILFVDETENTEYFIVAGLLVDSKDTADQVYKTFKKKARNMSVAKRDKAVLFTEFKSTLLDRHYQRIKVKMIEVAFRGGSTCHLFMLRQKREGISTELQRGYLHCDAVKDHTEYRRVHRYHI